MSSGKKSNKKSNSKTPSKTEIVEEIIPTPTPKKSNSKTPSKTEIVVEQPIQTPKKSNGKTPSKTEIIVEEATPKKQTPKNKSAVASLKKETPKVKAAPIEGFFLLDNLKVQGGDDIQTENQESLLTVLTQALQNNEISLLDSCFENQVLTNFTERSSYSFYKDNDLIENTLKKLPQNKVVTLFEKIAERVENGKKANYNFLAWLSSLIRNHSTFLLKLPEISTKITPLIALLQKRTLALDQIHRLRGKIDMVLKVETEIVRTKKVQKKATPEQKSGILYEEDEELENTKKAKKAAAKGGKKQGYTKAMEDLEDIEGEEEDFGGEDFEEEEGDEDDEEENGNYDAYLNEGGDDYEEGEDDEEDFDEEEEGDDDENAFDME